MSLDDPDTLPQNMTFLFHHDIPLTTTKKPAANKYCTGPFHFFILLPKL